MTESEGVLLIDRGGTRVGIYSEARLKPLIDAPWTTKVRSRKTGKIVRLYLLEPEPEPEPYRKLQPGNYTGQHYSSLSPIYQFDRLPRLWQLKSSHKMPFKEMHAVILECGAKISTSN